MVLGISETAPADSSTPQSESVSNGRLSVATTEVGGEGTVWVPLLSSTSMVAPPSVSPEASPPHAATARTAAAAVAARTARPGRTVRTRDQEHDGMALP